MATIVRAAGAANSTSARIIRAVGTDSLGREADVSRAEEARREATELVELARAEADDIRRHAHEEGLAAGLLAAQAVSRNRGDESAQSAARTLVDLVEQIERTRAAWLLRWERDLIGLAVAMAERIVRREVREHPQLALDLVRESLELSAGCPRVRLVLHSEDLSTFETPIRQLAQQLGRLAETELAADDSLQRGECRVTTDHGEIDQRFSTQLARLIEELS